MNIRVQFHSYFKELAAASETDQAMAPGGNIADLLSLVLTRFPKLRPMRQSMLVAVGVEYQGADYTLKDGDEVSLFPPVQGG